jgi:hypothetical protein
MREMQEANRVAAIQWSYAATVANEKNEDGRNM